MVVYATISVRLLSRLRTTNLVRNLQGAGVRFSRAWQRSSPRRGPQPKACLAAVQSLHLPCSHILTDLNPTAIAYRKVRLQVADVPAHRLP